MNDLDDLLERVNASFTTERVDRSTEAGFDPFPKPAALVTADFNGDGVPDVAISGMDSDLRQVVRIHEGEGGCGPGVTVAFPERGAGRVRA